MNFTLRVDSRTRGRVRQSPHESLFSASGALTIQSSDAIDSPTIVRSGNDIVVEDNQTPVGCGTQATMFNTHVTAHTDNSDGESYFTGRPARRALRSRPDPGLMGAGPDSSGRARLLGRHGRSADRPRARVREQAARLPALGARAGQIVLARGGRSRKLTRESANWINRVGLTPVLRRMKARGRYRLTLVATDRAGNRSKPVRVRIK